MTRSDNFSSVRLRGFFPRFIYERPLASFVRFCFNAFCFHLYFVCSLLFFARVLKIHPTNLELKKILATIAPIDIERHPSRCVLTPTTRIDFNQNLLETDWIGFNLHLLNLNKCCSQLKRITAFPFIFWCTQSVFVRRLCRFFFRLHLNIEYHVKIKN